MLVLTRKPGESIRIGSDLRITLVSSSGTQARIAISAPDEVPIHREEVYQRIVQANREAANAAGSGIESRGSPAEAGAAEEG